MLIKLKKGFYFPLANYFRFFAKIRLRSWNPYIIVITGSSGKTTLLHLLESQIGEKARYSHHANSSFGIPFDILGLRRKSLGFSEWFYLFASAPLSVSKPLPKEKIYVVEADADRPEEGEFLATLLLPNITLWTNSTRTHSMNFDKLVKFGFFKNVEEAIAHEFGYFLQYTKDYAVVNGDSKNIISQIKRANCPVHKVYIKDLKDYKISNDFKTTFVGGRGTYKFDLLLLKVAFNSIQMMLITLRKLGLKPNLNFKNLSLPPGRNSVFKGIRNTTIIDSAYNANLDSMSWVLDMFLTINHEKKWIVIGDMLEQGKSEKEEHEKLAGKIKEMGVEQVILMGPRVIRYTFPLLQNEIRNIVKFENPREVLNFLLSNLEGGELILFKGARFLEGVIENLLEDKNDASNLARREKVWQKRRAKFGL